LRQGSPVAACFSGVHRANGERAWLSILDRPDRGAQATPLRAWSRRSPTITPQREAQIALERANARFTRRHVVDARVIYQYRARDDGTSAFTFVAGTTLEWWG